MFHTSTDLVRSQIQSELGASFYDFNIEIPIELTRMDMPEHIPEYVSRVEEAIANNSQLRNRLDNLCDSLLD